MDVFESPKVCIFNNYIPNAGSFNNKVRIQPALSLVRPFNTIYWKYEPSVIISNVKIYSLMIYLYVCLSLSLSLSLSLDEKCGTLVTFSLPC